MPNIRFNYLYRDGGNYKFFGDVVFMNCFNFSLQYIQVHIISILIDETWFYPEQWGIKPLFESLSSDDPTWHEFESIGYTEEKGTIEISEFLKLVIDT